MACTAPSAASSAAYFGASGGPPPQFSRYVMPPQTPWAAALSNPALSNGLPPNHPILQEYAKLVFYNISRLGQLEQNSRGYHDPNNNWQLGRSSEVNNNIHLKADHYQKNGLNSPPIQGSSPRNSSPVQDNGNLTNNLSNMDLNISTDGTLSQKMGQLSLVPSDVDQDESGSSGIGTNSSGTASQSNFSNFFLDKLSDRRAPGCEMKTLQK